MGWWTRIGFLGGLALAGCKTGAPDDTVVVVLSPSYDAGASRITALEEALSQALDRPVAVSVAESEAAAVATMGTTRWDVGLLPLFDYLFCAQEYGVQAVARVVRKGGAERYAGEIVVSAESDITDLSALQGKSVAFVDHTSTSGFVLPMALLVRAGVEVEPVYAGSHAKALEQLRAGTAVAAATYEAAVIDDASLRALARTDEIPNEPIFVRADVSPALREEVVSALVAYGATEAGRSVLAEMAGIEGFVVRTDADYAAARTVVEAAGMQVEDLVERGWWIANANRAPMWGFEP